jgi:hypothetical protein
MKTTGILLKGGQKHVTFIKADGKKATKAFPETTSRAKIDEAIKKLDSQPATRNP